MLCSCICEALLHLQHPRLLLILHFLPEDHGIYGLLVGRHRSLKPTLEVPDSPFHLLGLLSTQQWLFFLVHSPFHDRQGWLTFCSVVSLHGLGMPSTSSLSAK